ncbi:MAG: tRNA (pseudouridine(54)-N(1))-methyltransferase TrmY [Candidatus Aenigmatarchaeota archaeon]|jgi:tRNA (pseudouridine54-N1)-methyltransferase
MREFILFSRGVTKEFKLNDLPNAGRMDLIARCISTAIFLSYSLRKDVKFHVVLNGPPSPPLTVTFFTNELKNVYPDERNIASHINIAIKNFRIGKKNSEAGIYVEKKSFEEVVKEEIEKYGNDNIFYLNLEGEDIRSIKMKSDSVFILGDNKGIPKKEESFLLRNKIRKVSVGRIEYLSSQVITIVNYEMDREGL